MRIHKFTDQFTNSQKQKQRFFACLFFIFLVASPIIQIANTVQNIKYELADTLEIEESTHQETVSELENETIILPYFSGISFQIEMKKQPSYFIVLSSLSNYKQDIQLPPPQII